VCLQKPQPYICDYNAIAYYGFCDGEINNRPRGNGTKLMINTIAAGNLVRESQKRLNVGKHTATIFGITEKSPPAIGVAKSGRVRSK